ncbi:hypothetical protein MASR1M59_22680 [Melaminivora sp.]
MDKINVSLGLNQSLALSESRIKNFLDGNNTAATKMGWFDTVKDKLFNAGAKQAALEQLAQEFDASKGLTAFDKFERLSQFADPAARSQFTVAKRGSQEAPTLEYRIKDLPVKTDQVSAEQWSVIETRLGHVTGLGGLDVHAADWLGQYERTDLQQARSAVTDDAFKEGGVHKRFDPQSGVLRAEDSTGAGDFEREGRIETLAETSEGLARYVSTQKPIASKDMATELPSIESTKAHAVVTLYDSQHVKSGELDKQIGDLSAREAHSVLMQTVDMARVFYHSGVSHQDLHMHNLMVHQPTDPQQSNITLKAIDFGKSKVGVTSESDRLNDVRYLFHKKASSGAIETARRDARELLGYDLHKMEKHYPLHKLMEQCARAGGSGATETHAFDEGIRNIGDRLVSGLQHAETLEGEARTAAIDQAFNHAMQSLSATSDHLSRPRIPEHGIRV